MKGKRVCWHGRPGGLSGCGHPDSQPYVPGKELRKSIAIQSFRRGERRTKDAFRDRLFGWARRVPYWYCPDHWLEAEFGLWKISGPRVRYAPIEDLARTPVQGAYKGWETRRKKCRVSFKGWKMWVGKGKKVRRK